MQKTKPPGCWMEVIADLKPVLRTLLAIRQKSQESNFCEAIDSYINSISKFGSFKNPLATITSLPEVYFRLRKFVLLIQTKKVISRNYGSNTSSWKPWRWVRLELILSIRNIHINTNLNPLIKFTSSSRSTTFIDILLWNISQMIMKTVPISTLVIGYVMKQGIPLWIWWKVNRNWDNNMLGISQWRESHGRTHTSVRRKKSKKAELWESQFGILVGNVTIWVRSFEIFNYNKVHQIYQFHHNS